MKRRLSLFLLLGMVLASFAANGIQVSYIEIYREMEEQAVPDKNFWNLLTDGERSSFVWIQDSTIPAKFGPQDGKYEVWKNVREEGELVYKGTMSEPKSYYEEPIPNLAWEMLPGDSAICDYPCQKARVTFRGRTWTVWYTLELPYSDGPWKLCGLPGLILKAEDSKRDFLFSAYRIAQVDVPTWKLSTRSYQKTTPSKYASNVISTFLDMKTSGFEKNMDGTITFSSANMKPDPKTACLYEYFDDNKK